MPRKSIVHFPLIQIIPVSRDSPHIVEMLRIFSEFSHIIFTSKTTVSILMSLCSSVMNKICIAIGASTAEALQAHGAMPQIIAKKESAEGIIEELTNIHDKDPYFLWGHSALSRPLIGDYMKSRGWRYKECELYNTVTKQSNVPLPDLSDFDEIIFTSPSCVSAFIEVYGDLPRDKILTPIGPITQLSLTRAK